MRQSLFFAGLAAVALTLVGCNKEADLAPNGKSVEIVLTDAQTRTVNDGLTTIWKVGDELSVFNAPTSTTDWSANIKFTVQDVSSNRATGEVTLTEDAYDWYAFYPYTEQIPNPTTINPETSKPSGYTTVGGKSQIQREDDNMDHLAGKKVPVFGNVKNVPVGEIPAIEMKNAAAVVRFKVTNSQAEDIHILSVKFTAPEDIVGTYYIDFSGTAPSFVGSGESYVYDNVTVTNSTPVDLAPDSNSEFYAVIKPFTAEAGSKLKLEIEAENVDGSKKGTTTKEITLTADAEFKVGCIKTLTVPFDATMASVAAKELPYSEVFKGVGIGDFTIENVTIPPALSYVWTYDSRYGMKASAFLSGTAYATESWLISPKINLSSATTPQLSFKHAVNQFASIDKAKEEATVWVREENGTWTKLEGVNYPSSLGWAFVESGAIDLSAYVGKKIQVGFKYTSTEEKSGTWEVQDFLVQDAAVPEFGVDQTSFEVAANATSVTVNVTGNVNWTVQDASEGVTATPTSGSGAGTIAVNFPANTAPTEKFYSLKVVTDNAALVDAGEEEFVIDITQAAASTEAKDFPFEESFATSQGDFTIDNTSLPEGLTYVWAIDTKNACMKASAYVSNTNYAAESWLISPVVDLATAQNPALTFSHATNYFSSVAKAQEETSVWVREEGGSWAAIEGVNYPTNLGWTFAESGSLDLSAYKGKKVQIGFKYTSTATKAGTWEIRNFKLDEGETGPVDQSFTWDLSTASYSSANENQVVWTHDVATMTATKAGASTNANNYLGGDSNNRTSSRFYANSNLAFAPASGITIIKVEYTATSTSYASAMANSTWTNASAVASGTKVEITPADGTQAFSAVLGAVSGGTAMKVYYSGEAAPGATLTGIAVSGQKTEFTVGDTFTHDTAVVTATYSDNSTKNVTASATFSEPDMSTAGTKEVTISYTEGGVSKSTSYNITVSGTAVNTLSITMNEYVAAHGCTVSANNVATMYKSLRLNDSVKMSTTGEDNCGSFWGATTVDWRLYQAKGGDVTISVADGCELKSVKFTYGVSNGGTLLDASSNQVSSGTTVTASGSSVTFTVGNTGEATNGQVKITAVEVKYTGEGTFPVDPDVPTVITTVINMPGNQTVYVGETIELNATSNVEGATITYESEDPTIASVSAAGVVTGVAEGTVKVYARIAGVAGSYTDAERYCNVTVSNKPDVVGGTWEATALSSIADGAEFILVSTKGDASYAMSNDNGTGSAPAAVSVTVSGNTLSNPASNLVFVLKKVEGGYVFGIKDKETTLYCFNNNNGLRVGTNAHNVFSLDSESGYLVINDGTQNRYIGVYNNADWRSYTSVNNNIKDQTFTFFVKK
jgi:hypothetical protein